MKRLFSFLMAAVLAWGLVGCSNLLPSGKGGSSTSEAQQALDNEAANLQLAGQLSEVAPPPVIQELSEDLEAYQPQVTIVSPKTDEVVSDTTVSIEFQVQDLPVFKNSDLGLGPHLHVIVDNQPYQAVYNLNQPLVLENLSPGTHSLRVFASRPWHESFKNEGAYAQTIFHVLTKSTDNTPDPALPLLTYSRPTGSYGAEPIMLDFYLTNAPLHLVAQENPDDDIADWRIRVTVNGESFVLDHWQPVYLKGFKPGKNWVKLEFLDEQGNPVKNVFNETLRVINYEPNGQDTLSKLVRGELSAAAARGIVDPNYKPAPPSTPTPGEIPAPIPSPSPTVTPAPIPPIAPSVEVTPSPAPEIPLAVPTSPIESLPTPEPEASPTPALEPTPVAPAPEKQSWFGGFFNRFRRPAATPSPAPERLEQDVPTPPPAIAPEEPQQTPEPEALPAPSEAPATAEEPTPTQETTATTPPSEPPASPEVLETPSVEPTDVPEEPESSATTTAQPEESAIPSEAPAVVEEPTPTETPSRKPPGAIIQSWFKGLFNRVSPPTTAPIPAPVQVEPEIITPTPAIAPEETQQTPEPEGSPTPSESPAAIEVPTPKEETTPSTTPASPEVLETPTEETTPSTAPTSPEVLETPSTEPILVPETLESPAATTPESEESVSPSTAPEEPTPSAEPVTPDVEPAAVIEPVPVRPIQPEASNTDDVLPTLPELIEKLSPEPSEPEAASAQPEPTQELSSAIPQEAAPQSESPSDTASVTSEPESPIDNQSKSDAQASNVP